MLVLSTLSPAATQMQQNDELTRELPTEEDSGT
jgi:hypothetical protein